MPTPSRSHHARRRAALESALAALIVALACSLLVDTLGELAPLRFVRKATWDWLSSRLDGRAQNVVVVDISSIRRPSNAAVQPVTDREQLLDIVRALRTAGAASIGIDIDFSPEHGEPVSERDPHVLAVLGAMHDDGEPPVVVHVGVGRGLRSPKAEWLGDATLADLAAAIAADASDNRLMPLSLKTPWGDELPPLGFATAWPCLPDGQLPEYRWSKGLASPTHEAEEDGLQLTSFFVDFSTLPDLLDTRLPAAARGGEPEPDKLVDVLRAELIADPSLVRGKAVFVGYADPAHMQDNGFVMPGRLRALPGVYAHAAAAAALLGPGWLYEPTPLLEVVIDVGLTLLLIGTIYFLRSRIWRRWSEQDELALHPLLTALLLLVTWTWLAPWLLVSQLRVIPHGLPIVTLAMLVELLWVPILVLVQGGSHDRSQEEGPVRKNRVNVLIVVVGLLFLGVVAKLMFNEHEGAAPPQPPLTRQALAGLAPATPEREPTAARLDLLDFGTTRSGALPETVGPRVIGTDSREAAELHGQADAAEKAGEHARAARLAHEGLVHDPDFPQLLVIAAVAELACGDERLQVAERLARRAAELAPMYAEAHYNLACAVARQSLVKETAAELALTIRWFHGTRADIADAVAGEPDFDKVRDAPEIRAVLQGS